MGAGVSAVTVLVIALLVITDGDDERDDAPAPVATAGSGADIRQESLGSFDPGQAIPVTLEEGDVSFLRASRPPISGSRPRTVRAAPTHSGLLRHVDEPEALDDAVAEAFVTVPPFPHHVVERVA